MEFGHLEYVKAFKIKFVEVPILFKIKTTGIQFTYFVILQNNDHF